jgi:hypothetical protein
MVKWGFGPRQTPEGFEIRMSDHGDTLFLALIHVPRKGRRKYCSALTPRRRRGLGLLWIRPRVFPTGQTDGQPLPERSRTGDLSSPETSLHYWL